MATACLRLLTVPPLPAFPRLSVPRLRLCIALLTSFDAPREYRRAMLCLFWNVNRTDPSRFCILALVDKQLKLQVVPQRGMRWNGALGSPGGITFRLAAAPSFAELDWLDITKYEIFFCCSTLDELSACERVDNPGKG